MPLDLNDIPFLRDLDGGPRVAAYVEPIVVPAHGEHRNGIRR